MIRKLLAALFLAIAALVLVVAVITFSRPSRQSPVTAAAPVPVDAAAAAGRLAAAVRIPTVSSETPVAGSTAEFARLHQHLVDSFPRLHAALKREVVNQHSLLYTWTGRDPAAPAVMLMAHQDVVPIAPGTEKDWTVPPFGGVIRNGFVWGRGAWDDKGSLMALLEAIELRVALGFVPARTIYLAFGHDEELGGSEGAQRIANLIRERGIRLSMVLDEGMLITEQIVAGLAPPAAIIGVAEKGILNVALTASGKPGHSSMPPRDTAIGVLSRALARLDAHPMPARLEGLSRETFETLAPAMSGLNRVLLSNLWLFKPLVEHEVQKQPSSNAALRTTTALTVLRAGDKVNVLPGEAHAIVNFRLLPGDSSESVLAHVKAVVGDPAIQIKAVGTRAEASRVSSTDSPGYRAISRTLRELDASVVVAPGLMVGGTDSRHFDGIADTVFKFMPIRARAEDLPRFHGTDERMSITNYVQIIQFYHRLIGNLDAAS